MPLRLPIAARFGPAKLALPPCCPVVAQVPEEASAVYNVLSIIENVIDVNPGIAETVVQKTKVGGEGWEGGKEVVWTTAAALLSTRRSAAPRPTDAGPAVLGPLPPRPLQPPAPSPCRPLPEQLLKWLLARLRPREADSNKQYASEILAILVQHSGELAHGWPSAGPAGAAGRPSKPAQACSGQEAAGCFPPSSDAAPARQRSNQSPTDCCEQLLVPLRPPAQTPTSARWGPATASTPCCRPSRHTATGGCGRYRVVLPGTRQGGAPRRALAAAPKPLLQLSPSSWRCIPALQPFSIPLPSPPH